MGTWGAAADHDGQEGVPHMGANQSNVPIEMIEADYPLRIERYGIVPDTGGPGRYRGGLVADARVPSCSPTRRSSTCAPTSASIPPHGLFGGGTGAPSHEPGHPRARDEPRRSRC